MKRIKAGRKDKDYAETVIAMLENVRTSSTAKLPNC